MNYALIGCGRVAPNHIRAAKANGFRIAAVCDTDNTHIDEMFAKEGFTQEEINPIHRYTDYETLLQNEAVDLISIALPSGEHAACALRVIERGIHVIIEKPIALSLEDADKIIAAGEKYGVKVAACHQNRFNIAVQEMRTALEKGRFGILSNAAVTVRWHRDENYYAQADWRGTWKEDGGTLMNQCIHGIDLLRWMCGDEIVSVYGVTRRRFHPYMEAEDVGTAVLEFKNGMTSTLEGTVNVSGRDMEEHLTLLGEHGAVKLGGTSANTIEHWHFDDNPDENRDTVHEKTRNVYGNGHTSLFKDMADAVKEDRAPYVDAKAGRRALEAVLAVYLSSFTGQKVMLPLKNVSTTDFTGMFDR